MNPPQLPPLTHNSLLGGRVHMAQPVDGYRVAMDTIFMAAAVPAQPGHSVLEAGIGTGGGALCLAKRVAECAITGVEIDPELAAIGRLNIQQNHLAGAIRIIEGDFAALASDLGNFDHAMINPPFLEPGRGEGPPIPLKRQAHMNSTLSLNQWIDLTVRRVREGGSFTIIHRADRIDDIIARLHGRVGDLVICPLWPRAGEPAKRVIVQGRKSVRGRARLHPGLILHGQGEGFVGEALSITRDGAPLDLGMRGGLVFQPQQA